MSLANIFSHSRTKLYKATIKRVRARKQGYEQLPVARCCVCEKETEPEQMAWTGLECLSCYRDLSVTARRLGDATAHQIISLCHDRLGVRHIDLREFFDPIWCFSCGNAMEYQSGGRLGCLDHAALSPRISEWLKKLCDKKGYITPTMNPNGDYSNVCPHCRTKMATADRKGTKVLQCQRCHLYLMPHQVQEFMRFDEAHRRKWTTFPIDDDWSACKSYIVGDTVHGNNDTASGKVMHCIKGGVTGDHEPIWPGVCNEVIDGTVRWKVQPDPDHTSPADLWRAASALDE